MSLLCYFQYSEFYRIDTRVNMFEMGNLGKGLVNYSQLPLRVTFEMSNRSKVS